MAVKLPVVAPAATVTEAGTVSAVLFEESATEDPPVGAACVNVAVQLEVPPELTVVGVHCRLVTVICGDTVTVAVFEAPFSVAVTVTV